MVSAENGLLAIRDMLMTRRSEVKAVTIENYADFCETVNRLDSAKIKDQFDWIVFDSLTEIGDQCLAHMTKTHGATTWKRYEVLGNEMIAQLKHIHVPGFVGGGQGPGAGFGAPVPRQDGQGFPDGHF